MTEFLHRYYDTVYSPGVDEWDNPLPGPGRVEIHMHSFSIVKRTAKGAWISVWGKKQFVLLTARKKFACETPEEALESFIKRKERQISILSTQLRTANIAKERALELKGVKNESCSMCRPIGLW